MPAETKKNHSADADRVKEVYKVTIAGSIINVVLLVLKFAAGILGHSAAMIADAIHSLTDFATDVVVLVFVKLGNKPKDKDHDYGHGKYETLATAIIGISLFVVGVMICYSCVTMVTSRVSRGWDFPMLLCNTDQSMICMPFAVWMKRGYLVQLHR